MQWFITGTNGLRQAIAAHAPSQSEACMQAVMELQSLVKLNYNLHVLNSFLKI